MLEYLPIIIPAIMGYGTSMICKVQKKSGGSVNFRPSPIIFSIVWPLLYILLGLSWFYSRKINQTLSDVFYILLNIALVLWIFVYSCKNNKKYGIYVLILSFVFVLCCSFLGDIKSKLLIAPLIGWILFATLLNVFEVQNMKINN